MWSWPRCTRNLAVATWGGLDPTIAPVSFYIIRPAQGVDAQYLAWYLNQPAAQAAIDQVRTGAGTPVVQRRAFEQIEILLPPPHEQREVAELAGLSTIMECVAGKLGYAIVPSSALFSPVRRPRVAAARMIRPSLARDVGIVSLTTQVTRAAETVRTALGDIMRQLQAKLRHLS